MKGSPGSHGVGKARVSPARTVATSDRENFGGWVAIRGISNRYDLSLQFSYFAPRMQEGIARKRQGRLPRSASDGRSGTWLVPTTLALSVPVCDHDPLQSLYALNPDSNEGGVITPGEITGIELDPRHKQASRVSLSLRILRRHSSHRFQKRHKTTGARPPILDSRAGETVSSCDVQFFCNFGLRCHTTHGPWRCSYLPNLDHMPNTLSMQFTQCWPENTRIFAILSRPPPQRMELGTFYHYFTLFASCSSDLFLVNNTKHVPQSFSPTIAATPTRVTMSSLNNAAAHASRSIPLPIRIDIELALEDIVLFAGYLSVAYVERGEGFMKSAPSTSKPRKVGQPIITPAHSEDQVITHCTGIYRNIYVSLPFSEHWQRTTGYSPL